MYINKAFVFGNLTRDPELRSLPSGNAVTNFAVATNRTWKDKEGVKREDAEFHNIVTFGKQAELVAQYLRKGSSVFIEGRLQTRSWDDANGVKKYRTEIVADRVQFGPRGSGGGMAANSGGSFSQEQKGKPQASTAPAREELETIEYPEEENKADDIPF
ncbi:MAG: single-stranded DNA-binding protein [Parcubacteria group bacterium]|nr:single-stranded DNA-binding protein [Parcubacteria group bacterium]MBI3074957.1 single-stranded DNA-binding protein [Parcubacteria group bacterium]